MDLAEYLEGGPPFEQAVCRAVLDVVAGLGPVHIEPVSVGIFLKAVNGRSFAQLRPMTRWETLSFSLAREARHPRITRKVVPHGSNHWHVLRLDSPENVDDSVVGLLAEAYDLASA